MNLDTANRLNVLLKLSHPYSVGESDGSIYGGNKNNDWRLWERIKPIVDAARPYVLSLEISEAAKERREATTNSVEVLPNWWRQSVPWEHSAKEWKYCRQQIKEAVRAFNSEILHDYEQYRLACEQGVAVPPPT